jgi:hypothetical protein
LKPFFGVKILKFFDADPGWKKIRYGMEKRQIRDGKKSDPGGKKANPGWKKADPGWKKGGSGKEKGRIRDGKKSNPGSGKTSGIGKNILNPQHQFYT